MSAVEQAMERIARLSTRSGRILIGIAGEPGAGKSSLTLQLVRRHPEFAALGLDAFHLDNRILDELNRLDRKGSIDTFDWGGYYSLLTRLRNRNEDVVYCPVFDRSNERVIGSAIAIGQEVDVVIIEGNYLLADEPMAKAARPLFDEIWYINLAHDERLRRLVSRHEAFGKSGREAYEWANGSDEANARLIRKTRGRADSILEMPVAHCMSDLNP